MLESLIALTGAAILVAMVPGPSTVMIMRAAMASGRRAGLATTLGNETGVLLWGLAAAWQARRGVAGARGADTGEGDAAEGVSVRRCFRPGLVTNVANPKAGVFAVSFPPQFVPEGWPVLAVLMGFSVLWALIDLAWYTAVVVAVDGARRLFGRPGVRRRLEQVTGVVLVGLGVRLAAEAR